MIKRTVIATATAAVLAFGAAPANAQEDVCVTYDFTGRQLCVLEEVSRVTGPLPSTEGLDVCVTYDFTGRDLCVIRDTIGGGLTRR